MMASITNILPLETLWSSWRDEAISILGPMILLECDRDIDKPWLEVYWMHPCKLMNCALKLCAGLNGIVVVGYVDGN